MSTIDRLILSALSTPDPDRGVAERLTRAPDPEVIEVLETLLEDARAGKIRAIAVAMVTDHDTTATVYELGSVNLRDVHFAVSCLASRVMAHVESCDQDESGLGMV